MRLPDGTIIAISQIETISTFMRGNTYTAVIRFASGRDKTISHTRQEELDCWLDPVSKAIGLTGKGNPSKCLDAREIYEELQRKRRMQEEPAVI